MGISFLSPCYGVEACLSWPLADFLTRAEQATTPAWGGGGAETDSSASSDRRATAVGSWCLLGRTPGCVGLSTFAREDTAVAVGRCATVEVRTGAVGVHGAHNVHKEDWEELLWD